MTVKQHNWLTCLRYLKPYICLEICITFSISASLILPQGVIVYLVLVYSIYWQNFCEHVQMSIPLEILHLNIEHPDHAVVTGNSRAHTNTAEYGPVWRYHCHRCSVDGSQYSALVQCPWAPPAPATTFLFPIPPPPILPSWTSNTCHSQGPCPHLSPGHTFSSELTSAKLPLPQLC